MEVLSVDNGGSADSLREPVRKTVRNVFSDGIDSTGPRCKIDHQDLRRKMLFFRFLKLLNEMIRDRVDAGLLSARLRARGHHDETETG